MMPANPQSEFPNPCIVYNSTADFNYDYRVVITVLESTSSPLNLLAIVIIVGTIVGLVSIIVLVIVISRRNKKRTKKKMEEGYY
ncbi:MAG: hypothetical protein ACFFGP_11910 [Promethearchaeota archaeon]